MCILCFSLEHYWPPLFIFPGSPAEGRLSLVGLSGLWRSSVLAASSLLRNHLPWCHARGGQSDDALRNDCQLVDSFRDMLVNKMCLVGEAHVMKLAGRRSISGQEGRSLTSMQRMHSLYKTLLHWNFSIVGVTVYGWLRINVQNMSLFLGFV